jgi:Uma2 family endonuclease
MATETLHVEYDEQPLPPEGQPLPPKETLPTMYDLPDEEVDQPGMPDIFHIWQPRLLDETFRPPNFEPEEVFTASDLNIYYDVHDFSRYKRPDWFAVVGLPKLGEKPEMRLSYVIWQEGISPLIVVELLSPGTQKSDLGETLRDPEGKPTKWDVYERWLRVPYYVTFSRYDDKLRIFELSRTRYKEVKKHQGRIWIEEIGLGLGLWHGRYQNEERLWLRWYDRDGNWIPASNERAEQEQQRAEQEQQRAEQERQRAEQERQHAEQERQRAEQERQEKEAALQRMQQLEAKLVELGIDPNQL